LGGGRRLQSEEETTSSQTEFGFPRPGSQTVMMTEGDTLDPESLSLVWSKDESLNQDGGVFMLNSTIMPCPTLNGQWEELGGIAADALGSSVRSSGADIRASRIFISDTTGRRLDETNGGETPDIVEGAVVELKVFLATWDAAQSAFESVKLFLADGAEGLDGVLKSKFEDETKQNFVAPRVFLSINSNSLKETKKMQDTEGKSEGFWDSTAVQVILVSVSVLIIGALAVGVIKVAHDRYKKTPAGQNTNPV